MNIPFFCLTNSNFGDGVNRAFFNLLTNKQQQYIGGNNYNNLWNRIYK